jgi:hypothetical protein
MGGSVVRLTRLIPSGASEKASERRLSKAKSAEKAQFTAVNEHSEADFNAA